MFAYRQRAVRKIGVAFVIHPASLIALAVAWISIWLMLVIHRVVHSEKLERCGLARKQTAD